MAAGWFGWLGIVGALAGCGSGSVAMVKAGVGAPRARVILERFAPVVMLHPEEKYFPMDLGVYYPMIAQAKTEAFFTSSREAFQRGEVAAVVAHASEEQRLLQYWFFYPKNGCQGMHMAYRAAGIFTPPGQGLEERTFALCNLAIHEGDWEHVSVRLTPAGEAVEAVFYSQHEAGVWVAAKDLEFSGPRPVVYAALNSHANYPTSEGFHAQKTVNNGLLTALTGISWLEVGDVVTAPTSPATVAGAERWDTAAHLLVWGEPQVAAYAGYLAGWGQTVDARRVEPVPSLPGWLSGLVQTSASLLFALVPDMQALSTGEPPVSPWGRQRWRDFDGGKDWR